MTSRLGTDTLTHLSVPVLSQGLIRPLARPCDYRDCRFGRRFATTKPKKPRIRRAQVEGSGTPDSMASLKPVTLEPVERLRLAASAIEKGVEKRKGDEWVPSKLSGSVRGVPEVVKRVVLLARKAKEEGPEPMALLKVREADSLMKETGGVKPVSVAAMPMVMGAPDSLRIEEEESWSSLEWPKVDWARVSWANAPPMVVSITRRFFAPPDMSQDSSPSVQVKDWPLAVIVSWRVAVAGAAATSAAANVVDSKSLFILCPSFG